MRLLGRSKAAAYAARGCVATIGNFDGVHIGHRAVIERLAEAGRALKLPTCVALFEPQPREFFDSVAAPPRLLRLREKLARLAELPVDFVLLLRFNRWLAELPPEDFVREILIDALRIRFLVVGDDFRFGKERRGDFALLATLGREYGFEVSDTPPVALAARRVSSTLIREALSAGDLESASRFLGRPYSVCGRVVRGRRQGRELGFATANLLMQRKCSPIQGVFAVTMLGIDEQPLPGVANVGTRPTVTGDSSVILEAHLLDFSADIYGRMVEVVFHEKLRVERRFSDLAELSVQIAKDVESARNFFRGGIGI